MSQPLHELGTVMWRTWVLRVAFTPQSSVLSLQHRHDMQLATRTRRQLLLKKRVLLADVTPNPQEIASAGAAEMRLFKMQQMMVHRSTGLQQPCWSRTALDWIVMGHAGDAI